MRGLLGVVRTRRDGSPPKRLANCGGPEKEYRPTPSLEVFCMTKPIRRVGVIGAGVMGSGIAAHLANAGVHAILLDIVPPNLTDAEKGDRAARNRFAAGGLEKALKARLAELGNTEDDLGKLASCDLIIEALIEKIEPKRALFEKLEAAAPHAIVA